MDRKAFVKAAALVLAASPLLNIKAMLNINQVPEQYVFEGDGVIPNNRLPLLVYKNAFNQRGTNGAEWLEKKFKDNHWYHSWRWGIYPFHHYHSNTHEVLGVFQGHAEVHMGGPGGKKLAITAGDIIIIPAGVGHKCISCTDDFTVVGAYPDGKEPDLIREEPLQYHSSKLSIAKVPVPSKDPLLGSEGLVKIWK